MRFDKDSTVALAVIYLMVVTSCASYTKIQEPQKPHGKIDVGDNIKVLTDDKKKFEFKVTEISDQSIDGKSYGGKRNKVLISRIVELYKQEFSVSKTVLAIGGVALAIYTIVGITKFGNSLKGVEGLSMIGR